MNDFHSLNTPNYINIHKTYNQFKKCILQSLFPRHKLTHHRPHLSHFWETVSFCNPNLVTFGLRIYLIIFPFLNPYLLECSYPKISQMCNPIKYEATPPSGTSQLLTSPWAFKQITVMNCDGCLSLWDLSMQVWM